MSTHVPGRDLPAVRHGVVVEVPGRVDPAVGGEPPSAPAGEPGARREVVLEADDEDCGSPLASPPLDPVVADLLCALPGDRVSTDVDVLAAYRHDEADWADQGRPRALVRPLDTAEVAATVAVCARHRVPVVIRGAGTGVSGGRTPSRAGS